MWNILLILLLAHLRVQNIASFDDYVEATHLNDTLSLVEYTSDKSAKIDFSMLTDISKKLKQYSKFYTVDCANYAAQIPECNPKNETKLPIYTIYVPPMLPINPYTHDPMPHSQYSLSENTATEKYIEALILESVPNAVIEVKEQSLDALISFKFLNKFVLFSNNDKPTPMLKLLSYKLKNRIMICFVSSSNKEVTSKYDIAKFPSILLVKSHDFISDTPTANDEIIRFSGDITYDAIYDFAVKYASDTPFTNEEINTKIKNIKEVEYEHMTKPIIANKENISAMLKSNKGALLYIDANEHKALSEISKLIWPICNLYVVQPELLVETNISKLKPSESKLYYLPAGYSGESKINRQTMFPLTVKPSSIYDDMMDAINDNVHKLSSEQEFQSKITEAFINKGKNYLAVYLHSNKQSVNVLYSLLSTDPDFSLSEFTTFKDPSNTFLKSFSLQPSQLPIMAIIIKPENISLGQFRMAVLSSFEYRDYTLIKQELLSVMSDKKEEESIAADQKNTEELTPENIGKLCYSFKGLCVISVLPSQNNTEAKQFSSHLAVSNEVLTLKKPLPLRAMWINGSCHTDFLTSFSVDATFLPTFLVIAPSKKLYNLNIAMQT